MKGIIACLMLFILANGPVFAASWETSSFRTANGGLIRVGMSSEDARRELGPGIRRGKNGASGKKAEVWSYRGTDGDYRITVVHGQVTKIVVMPRR